MAQLDERTIMRLIETPQGVHEAFNLIVKAYSSTLYWQIRHMVAIHEDADDVLQNTFIKIWTNLATFRGESKLSTWLYRIAANEALSFLQKRRNEFSLDDPEATSVLQIESDPYFDGDEADALLQKAIAQLPDKQRIVFTMKYFDGMKYEDMSEILNTSVGALKASYHIAVGKIEQYLNEQD